MADGPDAVSGVDVSSLVALRQLQRSGQPDAVARIASRFLEETTERMVTLTAAVEHGDAPGVERAAHALKGVAGTVGAHEMRDLALQLEVLGREGRTTGARELVAALERSFARAQPVFEELRSGA